MPHRYVTFEPWIAALVPQDLCLARILKEAAVARDTAIDAGAASKSAPRRCRGAYESAERTMDSIRLGRLPLKDERTWKRATDALRKFTEALECARR